MNIDKELIFINKYFKNKNELFDFMTDELLSRGFVFETYRKGIKERESKFPTGFKLKNINVAMPHTDPKYTKTSKLIVVKLKEPVIFKNAENDEDIEVGLILGLIFENSDKHIKDLMKLAELLQDEESLLLISHSEDIDIIYDVLKNRLI